MALDAQRLLSGLLQKNYFPAQRKSFGEIPPIFTTDELTPEIALEINKLPIRPRGFDCVTYTATKFDLVPRLLSIPHPKSYIDLCFCIHNNWKEIQPITYGSMSCIKPADHEDGRIIIMDYEDREEKAEWPIENSFGKRFGVKTDISNCFPSIYSHSIAWAAVGQIEAKKNTKDKTPNDPWYNLWDKFQRLTTRNETKGVPIGPATSNVATEFILQKIDQHFEINHWFSDGLMYRRYIDDYECYADSRERAEGFIRELRIELAKYSLTLNAKKTVIYELPDASDDDWLNQIHISIPTIANDFVLATRFVNHAVALSKKYPGKSVLKYATKCLLKTPPKNQNERAKYSKILAALINVAFHHPILIPPLALAFKEENFDLWLTHRIKMLALLKESALNRRSDGVAWVLYYCILFGDEPGQELANKVIETEDCLSILLLYQLKKYTSLVLDFANALIREFGNQEPHYEIDKYWLLLYQLFLDGEISNPYPKSDSGHQCFEILKAQKVSFLRPINNKNSVANAPSVFEPKDVASESVDAFTPAESKETAAA